MSSQWSELVANAFSKVADAEMALYNARNAIRDTVSEIDHVQHVTVLDGVGIGTTLRALQLINERSDEILDLITNSDKIRKVDFQMLGISLDVHTDYSPDLLPRFFRYNIFGVNKNE